MKSIPLSIQSTKCKYYFKYTTYLQQYSVHSVCVYVCVCLLLNALHSPHLHRRGREMNSEVWSITMSGLREAALPCHVKLWNDKEALARLKECLIDLNKHAQQFTDCWFAVWKIRWMDYLQLKTINDTPPHSYLNVFFFFRKGVCGNRIWSPFP